MSNRLTTKKTWTSYWNSKSLVKNLSPKFGLTQVLSKYIDAKQTKSSLELGGYPGYYSVVLGKYFHLRPTLLDYFLDKSVISKLCEANNYQINNLTLIKGDLFKHKSKIKYDLVCSFGLIEHFYNLNEIILAHWKLVRNNGWMVMTVPNFLGLNGNIQKLFDPQNYAIHNLDAMNPTNIKRILGELSVKPQKIEVYYYGGLAVWLENLDTKPFLIKFFIYFVSLLGKLVFLTGFNHRISSPYLVIAAKK